MTRHAKHIRKQAKEAFFKMDQSLFQSAAFRSLKCVERCLLLELYSLYLPSRPDVFLSVKDAGKRLKVKPETAGKAFYALEEKGFIKLTRGELWQERVAREWRLTFKEYYQQPPTNDWKRYEKSDADRGTNLPQKSGQALFRTLAEVEHID